MFTPIFAGAIFTPEEFALLIAPFVAVCIAFAVGVALFIRSAWRLATRDTKSRFDIAVVLLGILLMLVPVTSAGVSILQERAMEREVAQALEPISTLPEDPFTRIRQVHSSELNDNDCDVLVARLPSGNRNETNTIIEQEATAFGSAGWTVTVHDDPNSEAVDSTDVVFHADGPNDTSIFLGRNDWGRLEYRVTDHSCADTEFIVGQIR